VDFEKIFPSPPSKCALPGAPTKRTCQGYS
jgi:hypothetical protein